VTTTAELLACLRDPSIDVETRAAAGIELGQRGDPRLDDGIVAIAAGVLHHKPSIDSPSELRQVAPFAIGRFLVTVSQFAEFIDAGGYDDPSLWSSAGWDWRMDEDIELPRFWDEPEWEIYLAPNQPVVGVSWFEADAYASFRQARLPSEDEWERACRGDDARDYPWGNDWNEHACGHRDYGPRCTTAVGIYPQGVSPVGVHDMVGNVWQWTDAARGAPGDYGPPQVVRGGAWNNLPWSIGSAGRNAFKPTARFSNLGLRLAYDRD